MGRANYGSGEPITDAARAQTCIFEQLGSAAQRRRSDSRTHMGGAVADVTAGPARHGKVSLLGLAWLSLQPPSTPQGGNKNGVVTGYAQGTHTVLRGTP
jgi:hypothetical protein